MSLGGGTMVAKLPTKLYFVSQSGGKIPYGNRGGGVYTILEHALDKKKRLQQQGASVVIYETICDWNEVNG